MSFIATAAYISLAIAVIGTGTSAYGQYSQAQSQKKWSDYNADVQRQQAQEALHASEIEAKRKREQGQQLIARQHVLYAKAGLDLNGTPTEVMLGTASDIETDAQAILHKGEMGYEQGMESATFSQNEGEIAANAGTVQAGSTLLSGLGNAASSYATYKSKNMQPGENASSPTMTMGPTGPAG